MIEAFYASKTGAASQQNRLDVIANNIANVNNEGYKAQSTKFQNLLYQNFRVGLDVTEGVGARVVSTTTDFGAAALNATGSAYDYAIDGDGFFAVRNTATAETYYTRSGNFQLSEWNNGFYLTTPTGELVLNSNMNPIQVTNEDQELNIGVFTFAHTEGFTAMGNNLYMPGEFNGAPTLNENAGLVQGSVEASNVNMAEEFSNIIEAQRVYQMTLRMLQTADEIENTINNFR